MDEEEPVEMSVGTILVIAGIAGLVLAVLAIPIAVAVLRRQGKAIAERIRREYEYLRRPEKERIA